MPKKSGKSSKKSTTTTTTTTTTTSIAQVPQVEQKVEEVAEQVATEVVAEVQLSEAERLDQQFSVLLETFKTFTKTVRDTMTTFQSNLRTLAVQSKKLNRRTRKRTQGNKTSNGFTKTVEVSPELLKFCGKPSGTQMSRNQVNNFIHTYIRENKLQNPDNKRHIVPDSKLKKILDMTKLRSKKELLEATHENAKKKGWSSERLETELAKVTDKEHVHYFNLQRLVKHHYL
jgi:chromatin remodeling complex protein RSC6